MQRLEDLKVKVFADCASLPAMIELHKNPLIKGFTTNPSLMRKAGISDFPGFAREVLKAIPDRPVCFEVLSDDLDEMFYQALQIGSWGSNVYVKIPIMNTHAKPAYDLIRKLSSEHIKLNVTAVMTLEQTSEIASCLSTESPSFISMFAGRIADTGRDPVPIMESAVRSLRDYPHLELIWASSRELLNIFHANAIGCQVITVTYDLLKKASLIGKDLDEYSLETVKMFYEDAKRGGYSLPASASVRT